MTEIELDYLKSLEENASIYFDKAKKAKSKAERIRTAIENTNKRIKKESKKSYTQPNNAVYKKRKRGWFEKFRWFYSSDGFLVVGGKDAQTNETIVKKHMEEKDLYFHADIQGAPHCVVKTGGKEVPEQTKKEAAQFAGIFSKAWSAGLSSVDVYSVSPEQVSKKAPSGESMGTGAFMIYGKREWFKKVAVLIALGVDKEGRIISGPESSVKVYSSHVVLIGQGRSKKGETAKQAKAFFESKGIGKDIHLDEFIAMIPAGGTEIRSNN